MWKCGSGLFSFRKRYHRRGNLEYIDQSHTNLTVVPEEILRHHNTLEELSLEANQLADLPKGLFKLTKLRRLILADNEIQDLTNDIGDLTNLEELDISKNDFQVIPDTIQKCTHLQVLDISSNTLGEVPDAITKLPQLTRWITNDIALNEIPPEIGSLSNLVVLELRENCIKFLPLSFSFLSNLRQLDLGGNELEELPDTIGQLTSLVELWLDNNLLTILPAEIGDLSALQCLDVSENRIEELPEEICGLHALTDLHCTANNLHEIPQGIGTLSKLQILKLDQNELDEVTENIGGCSALLELVLTENVIEFLPSTIGKLTNLSLLNIDSNRLYTFPPEIGQCAKLSVLSARENQLSKIPKEIGNCRCLTVLALSGNKLENLPLAVSSLPLKALWLSQNQSQSVLKLQVEDDDSSKEKVLTCFLFPQEKLKTQSIDDLHYLDNVEDDNNWEHIEKPSVIQFNEDDEHPKESHLQRHDTPYPKGLRERHPHLIAPRKRTESGGSIHSDGGHPRSTSPPPHGQHHAHHAFDKAPPQKQKLGVSLDENTLIIGTPGAAFVNPLMADENDNNENEQEEEEEDEEEEEESSANESTSDEDEEEDEDGEKRIRFNVASPKKETRSFDDDGTCKLHRIDTPHYLKDKRIVQNTENSLQLKDLLSTIQIRKESQEESAGGIMANSQVTQLENGENDTSGAWQPVIAERNLGNIFNDSVDGQPRDDDDGESTPTYRTEDETFTKVYEELSTTLERDGDSLGINIAGGQGTNTFQEDEELLLTGSHVALFEDEGVFITKIAEDGPASRDGVLKVGDKIIKVNETDISEFRHDEAVNELRDSGSTVELVVLREVTDQDQIELALNSQRERNVTFASEPEVEDIEIETLTIKALLKRDERGLGFSIAGGKAEPPFKGKTEEGVYISKITENGPAALDNRLQCGDRLLFINGVDVRLSKHGDVVKALTSGGEKVSIIASREKVIQKKMKPLSQINGGDTRSTGQSTKAETIDADDDREEPKLLVEEIVLKKSAGPLGMSIVGGSDHASHPFGVNEPGIFVSKVMKTGEAAKTNLCVGDRILRVNEQDMRTASHQEAVSALVSNEPQIRLLVRHDPPPRGIQEISITKKLGEKLGISIRGGAKGHPGNPFDKEDEGIFVSKVNPSGAAARDGRLRVGMRILEVNNTSLLGATHVDAVRALRIAGDNLTSIVCDGYDEQAANELNPQQDVFFNPAVCEPPRFSPDSFSSATSGDSCYSEGWNGKSFNDSRLDESLTEQNIEKLNNSEYDADKRAQKTNENNQVEELVGSVV